ncbi:hypothetical protein APHWI1_0447 [Anaplasma phagocytophilum str. ApWI1]|uniref:Uncharacterized protein n=1 Tax=Anaplasma phagocytophilum str. ApWI1 TaxID=1359155 RepID=A0A0F3PWK2_ANAPH|nr:hypothetical protein APHHGE2_1244 [Anaplasma phagocytophilum str. HGE2]KJV84750.1 hypothetical protein APHWI1_0447 [Anaplasma phagocytophilum str. ApWI1]
MISTYIAGKDSIIAIQGCILFFFSALQDIIITHTCRNSSIYM